VGLARDPNNVEMARQLAHEAGLTNVEFQVYDPRRLRADLGTFDYILAHRSYSRSDDAGRDALLAGCRDHLAPRGIACVSYHTLPGRAVHDMLRDMMRYEARTATHAGQALALARQLLGFVQASLVQDHPFDVIARNEAAPLVALDDQTLWRDHLAAPSHPVYFSDFVEHARKFSLAVAGDAAVGIRFADSLWPTAERQLEALDTDELTREMFRDVIRNRSLRHTLLVHESAAVSRSLAPAQLDGLYLEGALVPQTEIADLCSPATVHFVGQGQVRTSTAAPLVKAALLHLGRVWPLFVRTSDLVAAAAAHFDKVSPHISTADDIERLQDNLLHLAIGGSIGLHTQPASFVARAGERPQASQLARALARRGGLVVNRRHEAVALDPFDRAVLSVIDGSRDRNELVAHLAGEVGAGRLVAQAHEQPLQSQAEAEQAFGAALPDALARLASAALLIG
jgi:hypothetical protein